ncbi:Nucleotidyltransferase, putative [Methanolobus psychrophilus R15]|nr:Nucleotidyltransferase, putative [Methanolobus psychrophilus R15]
MPRDQLVFFADMLAAIEKIQSYMENITLEEFLEDEMRVDAVVRNLEIIGEDAGKIPPETRYLFAARAGYLGRAFST